MKVCKVIEWNGLLVEDRIEIAFKVEGTYPFDRARIIRCAVVLRGETFVHMIGEL